MAVITTILAVVVAASAIGSATMGDGGEGCGDEERQEDSSEYLFHDIGSF